ncbi:MAG: hypothetical protein HYY85_10270 [Deltaproteobacteria bacterium]|nr:hypothetical protein [Deltaproteobacteria bacterium]
MTRWLRRSYSVLFLLVLWEAVSRGGLVNPYFLPSATAVAGRLWGMLLTGGLAVDLGATVLRVLLAFGVASLWGDCGRSAGWPIPSSRWGSPCPR